MSETTKVELPGTDCGLCGFRTCAELAARLEREPELLERCIQRSEDLLSARGRIGGAPEPSVSPAAPVAACGSCSSLLARLERTPEAAAWKDHLGRDFDFYLEHFPEDPGPREIILPHNPLITRELDIRVGDVLIGRPLGMSCGCPITHCGVAMEVDHRTGVLTWCVTGPLVPRQQGFKDLGYYIAEGYEGIVKDTRAELKVGMRYFFQPRMCMLQWRHSGLLNYLNRIGDQYQVRLEGLWIG
jgi:uncharacterized Fe-S cluster-containing protein